MNFDEIKKKYNQIVSDSDGDYEAKRWFGDAVQRAAYGMTRMSILRLISTVSFAKFLELGPGPGTWTKIFITKNPSAHFDLVDISEEMIKQGRKNLASYLQVNYILGDFLGFFTDERYDFFFSSRAIEYFSDKKILVKKIFDLMKNDSAGLIITKTPRYLRQKLLRKKSSDLHQGQIKPKELVKLLRENGFSKIEVYPATISFPLFHSAKLNMFFYYLLGGFKLNFISQVLSESYCVKFVKV